MPSAEFQVPCISVICGPTAAGKSAVAMWLAARHDVAIISADSRHVYRGFDIGTAKPTTDDRRQVPHYGIDVADPTERYSAAAWSALAGDTIRQAPSVTRQTSNVKRQTVVVVGGTGFYISALFNPLWEEPTLDPMERKRVQSELAGLSLDELRARCEQLDPARAHLGRAQLLRALEVSLITGKRLSDMHRTHARPVEFTGHYLLVDPGLSLPTRIAVRAAAMLDGGWPEEVRGLMQSVPESAPAWNAAGYRTVRQLVRGEIDRAAALEKITIETRQFAKRQRTWFRNQLDNSRVTRLVPDSPGWEEQVERWFAECRVPSAESRS